MGSSMLKQTSAWLLFLVVIAMLPLLAPAQASAPAPSPSCSTVLFSLYPCLTFVQGNVSTPPKNCCAALADVVNTDVICLCTLFSGNNSLGIPINATDALNLPKLCKVSTPPPSTCSAVGYPVPASLTAPSVSPPVLAPTPSSTPPTSPTPASGVPSTSPTPASGTAPAPTTASPSPPTSSPSPTPVFPPGSSSSPTSSPPTTPPGSPTATTPPANPSPSPSVAGELSVSTALCFVALLVASLQMLKM